MFILFKIAFYIIAVFSYLKLFIIGSDITIEPHSHKNKTKKYTIDDNNNNSCCNISENGCIEIIDNNKIDPVKYETETETETKTKTETKTESTSSNSTCEKQDKSKKIIKLNNVNKSGIVYTKSTIKFKTIDEQIFIPINTDHKYKMMYDVISSKPKFTSVTLHELRLCKTMNNDNDNDNNNGIIETICTISPKDSICFITPDDKKFFILYKEHDQYLLKYKIYNEYETQKEIKIYSLKKIYKSNVVIKYSKNKKNNKNSYYIFITSDGQKIKPMDQNINYHHLNKKTLSLLYTVRAIGDNNSLYADILGYS